MSDGEAKVETPSQGQVDPPLCEAERRRAANIARMKEAEGILRVSTLCVIDCCHSWKTCTPGSQVYIHPQDQWNGAYLKASQQSKDITRKKAPKAKAKLSESALPLRRSQRPATLSASQKISSFPVESPAGHSGAPSDAAYEPDSEVSGKRSVSQRE